MGNDKRLTAELPLEKLRAETASLNRPYIKSPSSWITILTVILGLFGVGLQYAKSDRDYQLAEIKRQQAALETDQTEKAKQKILEEITQAQATVLKVKREPQISAQKSVAHARGSDA